MKNEEEIDNILVAWQLAALQALDVVVEPKADLVAGLLNHHIITIIERFRKTNSPLQ